MAEKFDPANLPRLEDPERLVHLPPENIVRLLDLSGAETVIDFGAGTGFYTLPIAEALPAGRVIAVDEQDVLLERLRERLAAHVAGARVDAVLSRDGRVPLPDGAANRMCMVNVLHHIHDDSAALAEVGRLLAPSGLLVSIDHARMDRPTGPPSDHVLSIEEARAVLADMGLDELVVCHPGEVGRYCFAIVARKPAP